MNYDYYDNVITKPPLNEETLTHFGVKGMRWGVRRYEKNAGTKTAKRIKKFKEADEKYVKAKMSGNKQATRYAKKEVRNQYKKVKQARLADQGAEIYANSGRITSNRAVSGTMKGVGGAAITAGAFLVKNGNNLPPNIRKHLGKNVKTPVGELPLGALVAAGGAALTGAGYAKDFIDDQTVNKKLRAYYSYTGK